MSRIQSHTFYMIFLNTGEMVKPDVEDQSYNFYAATEYF